MRDLETFFLEQNKGYVAMPTGSGKTVLFGQLLASNNIKSLVVVPTKHLVTQTIESLRDRGVEGVSTVLDTRSRKGRERYEQTQVIVTTYSNLVRNSNSPWGQHIIKPSDYGMVILDEAHHSMAQGARNALSNFDHAFQIGFTATPDYSEARRLKEKLPAVIHELSISEAIETNLITRYANTLLLTDTDMSSVKVTIYNEYEPASLERAMNTQKRNSQIADYFQEKLADKKAIFSCSSVDHSVAMAAELQRRGIRAAAIHGKMPKETQRDILDAFKRRKLTALCNNKILSEGFDDVGIEVVVNVSPTLSPVRQQQRTGRGLRLDKDNPGKELLIIDCVDTNYRRKPVLFCDEAIAGTTGLSTVSAEMNRQLGVMAKSDISGVTLLADDTSIANYLTTLTPVTTGKSRQPSSAAQSRSHKPTRADDPEAVIPKKPRASSSKRLGVTVINGVLQRSTERRYIIGSNDVSWRALGLCAETDPEAFFPEKGGSTSGAKKVCAACEVREDCLEAALDMQERFGIWGGLSERERRKLGKRVTAFAQD